MTRRTRRKVGGESLLGNQSTRLRFSVWVIIANFILGLIGMILGADLTALGVFLSLSNAPLYVYVLGRSFRPAQVPHQYYNQPHGGAGGLGQIINDDDGFFHSEYSSTTSSSYGGGGGNDYNNQQYSQAPPVKDDYNIPNNMVAETLTPKPVTVVDKPQEEIG